MPDQTVTLDAVKGHLAKLLQDVADQQVTMTVQLPDGKAVVIEPKQALKPLPELEGRVPNGWKDALYAHE